MTRNGRGYVIVSRSGRFMTTQPSLSDGRTSIGVWCRQRPDTALETKSENDRVCLTHRRTKELAAATLSPIDDRRPHKC